MKTRYFVMALVATAVLGVAGYGLYSIGMQRGMGMAAPQGEATSSAAAAVSATAGNAPLPQGIAQGEEATRRHISAGIKAGDVDPDNGHKVLYYHDPMVPGNKFDQPAKSPFMDMMLVPVYADSGSSDGSRITVSPRIQQNLGVRTAEVMELALAPQVNAVGSIAFNERDQAVVQARTTGFVEKLHVSATLDAVRNGQPLAELYVPAWIAVQEEFLSLRRMQGNDLAPLIDAARQRMRQAGMSQAQIELVERSGKTQPRIVVAAPIAGVVTELMVREGMTVMAGTTLFRINGLATVWANAEVPESQAALLRPGANVVATSPAVPGVEFRGKVQALLPEVNASTRTLKARLELVNRGGKLVPGMFVQMVFSDQRGEKSLVIPTEAVIQTGKRSVVMLAEADGRFRPVDVTTGIEVDGQTEIRSGLTAGQRVVVSSQFLIDSEATLKGVESRLNQLPQSPAPVASAVASASAGGSGAPEAQRHAGEAVVEKIGSDVATLSHGPIASMQMGAMTMEFALPKDGGAPGIKAGDRVGFEFFLGNDGPQLTRIFPLAAGPSAAAASGSKAGNKP